MIKMNLQYFGGRGSSSGISNKGNAYGSQYHTILESGNVKFVQKNNRTSESLMESKTPGRVYVTIGGKEPKKITYIGENKRIKTIDLDHEHAGERPHTHHGYFHNENDSTKGASKPTTKERKMIDKMNKIWYDHLKNK